MKIFQDKDGTIAMVDPTDSDTITLRNPCHDCGGTEGQIVISGPHQKVICNSCGKYQYFKPKDKPKPPSSDYTLIATLHKSPKKTNSGKAFYVGKASKATLAKASLYLFKNDDGSLGLYSK